MLLGHSPFYEKTQEAVGAGFVKDLLPNLQNQLHTFPLGGKLRI